MSNRLREWRARKAQLVSDASAILAAPENAAGLTGATRDKYATIKADIDGLNASIAIAEELEAQEAGASAVADHNATPAAEAQKALKEGDQGFTSLGEQLQKIAVAGMNKGGGSDPRLKWEMATGANEAVPSEGGFLVQRDFSTELLNMMHDQGELLSRVRRIPISQNSNGIKLPAVDEVSRVNGSRFGGVLAYWGNEGETVTASRPKFREIDLRLKKLMGIGYTTEELLADSVALGAVMQTAFVEELTFKAEDSIINGTGSGQMLGIINSGALITQAAEGGQSADTVQAANILKMWARTPIRSRKSLVWVINQDVEPQLYGLTLGSGTAVTLMYTPPGMNGNNTPYGLLMGRPVIPIEYAGTVGDVGDIILFDPQSYVMIDKGGLAMASSMHVRFVYEEMTFRFTFRVDGQPVWNKALTPFKGTNTISPYVALAAR